MCKIFTRAAAAAFSTLVISSSVAFAAGSHSSGHDDKKADGHGAANIGMAGEVAKADRTIEMRMGEMYFSAESIEVQKGEIIRFVLFNEGDFVHEFNIATPEMHAEHADEMMMMMERGMLEVDRIDHKKMMAGGMMHEEPNSQLLEPGAKGEVVWMFSGDAELQFSCNVPGHREGGMVGEIRVTHQQATL